MLNVTAKHTKFGTLEVLLGQTLTLTRTQTLTQTLTLTLTLTLSLSLTLTAAGLSGKMLAFGRCSTETASGRSWQTPVSHAA